jgi:signal transduction histidine kinase
MGHGVSRVAARPDIQTTPEIKRKKGGKAGATYRTWPVFTVALLALLGLMLVPAVTARWRSEAIYEDIRASQAQFQRTERVFEALSQSVYTISITIREFLLDNSPDASRLYRSRLNAARDDLRSNVALLSGMLPPDGNAVLQQLGLDVEQYLAVVLSVFDWTVEERVERGAYFLREEQRPRRETILAVAQQLSQLNTSVYAEQQKRITESEQRFRNELRQSALFALLTGIVVSAGGILRMRWLERRAAEQRERAEDTTEEIRKLSTRLRHAQEEERRAISRELHDDVGQTLTALRMELGTLERLRVADTPEFETRLAELKAMAEQSLHVTKDIAAGLRPSVLDDLGLAAAVQKQAREFSKRTGVVVDVAVDGPLEGLRDPHTTYVYRIVQEALTNCAKHARAQRIEVSLTDHGDSVELIVADDGVGFNRERTSTAGLGLIGMQERVRELGGTVVVQSAPGQGTSIRVSIPL